MRTKFGGRGLAIGICLMLSVWASAAQQTNAPRRALPKPPQGARGFEQLANRDAKDRLIAAGAMRAGIDKPLVPTAPQLGLAYDARPLFAWSPSFEVEAYRLTIYDDDVKKNSNAAIVYQTETMSNEFQYPANAPSLTPGRLYSWRVAAVSQDGKSETGEAVMFFVMTKTDADEVAAALAKAKAMSKNDALREAAVFIEYGVWYDALRIATRVVAEHPDDKQAAEFYDALVERLTKNEERGKP